MTLRPRRFIIFSEEPLLEARLPRMTETAEYKRALRFRVVPAVMAMDPQIYPIMSFSLANWTIAQNGKSTGPAVDDFK